MGLKSENPIKITFFSISLYIIIFSAIAPLFAVSTKSSPPETQNFHNIQDRSNPEIENPIKGLTQFVFFPMYPAKDMQMADRIFVLVEKKLSGYGQVNHTQILVQTDQGEAVDLNIFKTGVNIIYKMEDPKDLSGNNTGIVRASLNLYTPVEIVKTHEICTPYIWSCNCFLKGSTKKNMEKLISQSLDHLLAQFNFTYKLVNTDRPIFELQGAN